MLENNMCTEHKTGNAVLDAIAELKKNLPEDVVQQADCFTDLAKEPAEEELMAEYAKHHAPLTTAFHQEWKGQVIKDIHNLPLDMAVSKRYSSRYECEKAAREAIKHVYGTANKYVVVTESKCVARATASRYADALMNVFMAHKEALQSLCKALGKADVYQQIEKLVYGCKKTLRERYEEELMNSSDYYMMYRMDYFYDKIDIEESDNRISTGGLSRMLERAFTDSINYTYTGVWDAILELEKDLNENLTTFYRRAYEEYCDYIIAIEKLLDSLDSDFCKQFEAEKTNSPIETAMINMIKQEKERDENNQRSVCSS